MNIPKSKSFFLITFLVLTIFSSHSIAQYLENQLMPNPGWPGIDLNGNKCQGGSGYGPYDYTNPNHRSSNLKIVEKYHFNKDVEFLKKGMSTSIGGDINYTLTAFPNHHRALYAMARYQLKTPSFANHPKYPAAECYFQRAIKFTPNDFRSMQLYANYLVKKKQPDMAIDVYKRALSIKKAPPQINYSLGLLYFKLKKYNEAVEQAKFAYANGVKNSKLARKLKGINRWPVQ